MREERGEKAEGDETSSLTGEHVNGLVGDLEGDLNVKSTMVASLSSRITSGSVDLRELMTKCLSFFFGSF